MGRIHLSPPHMSETERELLLPPSTPTGWLPPGRTCRRSRRSWRTTLGLGATVALSSGTAALHLALLLVGVAAGDAVIVPTLTFAATANAVRYVGAEPVFVDAEPTSWNLDPVLVETALDELSAAGQRVGAVVTVDLYGQCADHDAVRAVCTPRGVPIVEDAAEAVGATWQGRPAGTLGDIGVFSFNGNKTMTTGGGGMLITPDPDVADRARHLATQAREPVLHYEHVEVGFNYRMGNLAAAIGRGQVRRLDEMVARRTHIREHYRRALEPLPGVSLNPVDPRGVPNHWLTVLRLGDDAAVDPANLMTALDAVDAEARPAWKPMHRQPVFVDHRCHGGAVADDIFRRGVCLPSGSAMTDAEIDRVVAAAAGALSGA